MSSLQTHEAPSLDPAPARASLPADAVADLERRSAELERELEESERQIAVQRAQLAERDGHIAALRASLSWRITAPLRGAGFVVKKAFAAVRTARSLAYQLGGW